MNYGTLWQRFAATLIDFSVLLPVMVLHGWLGARSREVAVVLLVPMAALFAGYSIYFHGRFGQTVGKRVMGIRVVRRSGEAIGWREAWLRGSVDMMFTILRVIASSVALGAITDDAYDGIGWLRRTQTLEALEPSWLGWVAMATWAWLWCEVVVMLFSRERRALHDFIAGTIVVREQQVAEAHVQAV